MSLITKRQVLSSVVSRVMASSFTTDGCSFAAAFERPVFLYLNNSTVARCWLGGSSAVTTGTGYLLATAGTTDLHFRSGEELWGICSAAAATTVSCMFTNQPV